MLSKILAFLFQADVLKAMKEIGTRYFSRRPWPHGNLEFWGRLLVGKLSRTFRWHLFYATEPEHVLGHMFKQTLTATTLVSLELKHGNSGLTPEEAHLIVAITSFHDIAEAEAQDFPRTMKEDPAIGAFLKQIEAKKLDDVLSFLPEETQTFMKDLLERSEDKSNLVGRLFDAAEWIGYLIFALEEVSVGGNKAFLDVIANSMLAIDKRGYAHDFVGVQMMLEPHAEKIRKAFEERGMQIP